MEVMAEICIEVCVFVNPLISELHSSKSKDKCKFFNDYGNFWESKNVSVSYKKRFYMEH